MTVVVFAALVLKVVDFLRLLADARNQRSAIVTQLAAWLGGVAVVLLAAHANVAAGLVLPGSDLPLHALNVGSQILLGLLVSSLASVGVDAKQALDATDSAAKPALLGSPMTPPERTLASETVAAVKARHAAKKGAG